MTGGRSDRPGEPTVLEDSGTAQVLLFVGWIPPLVAALICGLIVGLRTGSLGALVVVVIGGTLAGYIVSLIILFTVGHSLEQRRVSSWVANAFVVFVVVIGVAAAIAVAVSVGSERN